MTAPTWHQRTINADTHRQAVAAHVAPELDRLTRLGVLTGWWYIRKHQWRLRLHTDAAGITQVTELLDNLTADEQITGWRPGVYEPETLAFGGADGMASAHRLFHADSSNQLAWDRATAHTPPALGQREMTALLCGVLLRSAGLDRYEQADTWAKVAVERPLSHADPALHDAQQRAPLVQAMTKLLTVNPASLSAPPDGPLTAWTPWIAAFETAGQELLTLARDGRLRRGLRAALAHHIIFHANRAAISVPDLSTMAALAMTDTLGFTAVVSFAADPSLNPRVDQVTTVSDHDSDTPDDLRAIMTQRLTDEKVIRTPAVRDAFDTVPRHLFVPGVTPKAAYLDDAVYTKYAADGTKISAASQPRIVAMMLEQLDLHPGHNVLEAGAGTGYNAALMGHIVGRNGDVHTIDVDADLVEGAVAHLAAAGADNVGVLLGDGARGHGECAPYDRIIATVGVWDVPAAWLRQLAPTGRMVVPLRLRGATSRSIAFTRTPDGLVSVDSQLAVFMPLRGSLDDARRIVAINEERDVTLAVNKDQTVDAALLTGVLDTPAHTRWTGVIFPPMVPYEWIELWLALRLPNSILRMNTDRLAVDRGQVTPMHPQWGAMATVEGPDLAYLTLRPTEPVDGRKRYEIGVIGHGPDGATLADIVAAEAAQWDREYRSRSVRFEIPTGHAGEHAPDKGRFVIDRPHHPVTVIWE
ncbi:methyltransferase, FxLD system [Micromonospora sp. WMMD980]|uniref:methyltransferase, FxLD system n=1 Tax=Micromonospora sp. WMMD980 TaxID=3016088 RepID=UPI0024166CD3|nr:methyltransferase, FxLD system [Micromonospora sp. WMMD980]MDG4803705.1 methyltransferase, FxLD system [Micromonospora sp. WMMD980]